MPVIHPTAIVDAGAELADDVQVGPHCVIESDVCIAAGTRLREGVVIRRYTTIGRDNLIDAHCVLGGEPQDFKFDPATVTHLRIGDGNVFREGVTISRATGKGQETVVGSGTYWMTASHAGHNAVVEDGAVLVNGSAIGGHATLGAHSILSAHVVVHQFCRVGERVMTEGNCTIRSHVPPFTMVVGRNHVFSLNVVGLRRADDISSDDIRQLKDAFKLFYRKGLKPAEALSEMDERNDWGPAARAFRDFVRDALAAEPPYDRGIAFHHRYRAGG